MAGAECQLDREKVVLSLTWHLASSGSVNTSRLPGMCHQQLFKESAKTLGCLFRSEEMTTETFGHFLALKDVSELIPGRM